MEKRYSLGALDWSINEIAEIKENEAILEIEAQQVLRIQENRLKLELLLQQSGYTAYGINTGFGALCNTRIGDDKLELLQINLVRSHACGVGNYVSEDIIKYVLLLKIKSLCLAYSSVRLELIEFLIHLYNLKIWPCIPEMGSLGASGDLAPLAHLSLVCIGEGKVIYQGQEQETKALIDKGILHPPGLRAKEGIALLNGTQFSCALLLDGIVSARKLYQKANMIAALSLEAFDGMISAFHSEINSVRKQHGQMKCAEEILGWLKDSNISKRQKQSVQDPYSFRCIPQVHGASEDAISYVEGIVEREINAVTDNPLMLRDGKVYSGGNFHAQPLALSADFLSIAVAELANISERRIYQLVCGTRGLPDFLTPDPGLNSGYMIVQYAAAALVSMNKQLASPSSVDSIISSKGQEDHVSMSANAALKCLKIIENSWQVLNMEWMTACRAMHWRKDFEIGIALQKVLISYREEVPLILEDHVPHLQYEKSVVFLKKLK